jgi:hypothetical protein
MSAHVVPRLPPKGPARTSSNLLCRSGFLRTELAPRSTSATRSGSNASLPLRSAFVVAIEHDNDLDMLAAALMAV